MPRSSIDPYLLTTVFSLHLHLPYLRIQKSSNFSPELSRKVMTGELNAVLVTSVPETPRLNFLKIAATSSMSYSGSKTNLQGSRRSG
jgi:hypothetical protein